jgi:4,5-DOPA dioxygenase extradiol
MPVLFVGHGSPMNAVADNRWSRAFRALGAHLPEPRAILAVSAHWYVEGTFVTASARPATIHDFSDFPRELPEVEYPARGDVALASRVGELLASIPAPPSADWGLDHGTWSVLRHLRPAADVPVLQLSIDRRLRPVVHVAIAQLLAPLRDEGVLILGSGNAAHNLRHAIAHLGDSTAETPAWAVEFGAKVADALLRRDQSALVRALAIPAADVRRAAADALGRLGYAPEKPGARAALLVAREEWSALAELGADAVEPLLVCLPDEEADIRGSAAEALGLIGDRRALEPLRAALPDWFVNSELAAALEALGWKPSTPVERVYAAIAHRDGDALRERWSETHDVLIADVRSEERRKIENAVYAFVALGDSAVLPELKQILDEEGNVPMAETYLNCGRSDLDRAARDWAERKGYWIMIGPGACNATWGGW